MKKDIYLDSKIYLQVTDSENLYNYPSIYVNGQHDFKNGQSVLLGIDYGLKWIQTAEAKTDGVSFYGIDQFLKVAFQYNKNLKEVNH